MILLLIWLLSLLAVGLLGYHYSRLVRRVVLLSELLIENHKKPETEEPTGKVIDPDDISEQTRQEFEEQMRRLNG